MFCENCGNPLKGECTTCEYCNIPIKPKAKGNSLVGIGYGIASLVVALISYFFVGFWSPLGFACGIAALATARKAAKPVVGYLLGAIGTALDAFFTFLWLAFLISGA